VPPARGRPGAGDPVRYQALMGESSYGCSPNHAMDVRTNVRISETIPCLCTILEPAMTLGPTCRWDRRHGVVVTGRPAAAAAGPTWTWDRVGRGCDLCSARRDCDTARHCTTPRRASFGRRGTPGRNHSDARPAPRPRRHPPRRRHRGRPTVSRWRHCAPAHSS
jgi:hypothetical protein